MTRRQDSPRLCKPGSIRATTLVFFSGSVNKRPRLWRQQRRHENHPLNTRLLQGLVRQVANDEFRAGAVHRQLSGGLIANPLLEVKPIRSRCRALGGPYPHRQGPGHFSTIRRRAAEAARGQKARCRRRRRIPSRLCANRAIDSPGANRRAGRHPVHSRAR